MTSRPEIKITRRAALGGMTIAAAGALPAAALAASGSYSPTDGQAAPSAGLMAAIEADRAAESDVAVAQTERDRFYNVYLKECEWPSVMVTDGFCVPERFYSANDIKEHYARVIKICPLPHDKTARNVRLNATADRLCAELEEATRIYDANQRDLGIAEAENRWDAASARRDVTREAVFAYPCATLADVEAKGLHLLYVIPMANKKVLRRAFRSLVFASAPEGALS